MSVYNEKQRMIPPKWTSHIQFMQM